MGKKVLYSASTYSHLKNFHLPYLKAFQQAGWTTHAICGGAPMDLPYVDRVIHVPFTKSITSPENFGCVGRISALLKAEQYDLISTHTALAAFFTRLAVPRFGTRPRVINTVHGYLFDESGGGRRALLLGAEKLTAAVTDTIFTMNAADYEIATAHHLAQTVINTPGMGVDLARFPAQTAQTKAAARSALGLDPEAFYLVYAAEFSGRKNQSFLIRALPKLPPAVKYLLLGRGDLLADCQALAQELGVGERIVFPGHVQTAPYLTAADCCVSASRSEGLPFNLMEAMATGLPIVASAAK
ncbi:MAG: glycosyltransferase, partial [Pseudoflavonifractor sp.]